MDGYLCKQWIAANHVRYTPTAWRFSEYRPGHFALYAHTLDVALLTQDWDEVLTIYRARPPYIAPVRKPAIDLTKLDIKL